MSKAKLITTVADALLGGGNKAMKANTSDFVSKLKYSSSPIGRKGQSKNMKAFGYQLREQNPLITNKEMNEAWDATMGKEARMFDGEEYTFQPAGTKLTKETDISKAGMRPLMTKRKSLKDAGKRNVNDNRKPHYIYMKEQHPEWIDDYTAKNARAKMLNQQEIERRRAQGETVSDKAQFVMFEHDIAIRSPLWEKTKGANIPSNTFVNTNPRARTFKDSLESWFYTKMKKRGNNFYLKTDRKNMKDIEVWEISTNKLLFTIPFPEKFEVGESFAYYLSKDDILQRMRKTSTTFKG
tara:strand:+ start:589 stop:1476 length:888 start_codon:yes stop_codon:yes gene_type:complete